MGNIESQNGDHAYYGEGQGHLSRKHMTRSLRISNKQSRRSRHASSSKAEHRNSETSTKSSSTPSIPQSLSENGLEPFNEKNALAGYGGTIWVDRMAMNLRPMSFHDNMGDPTTTPGSEDGVELDTVVADNCDYEGLFTGEDTYLQRTRDGPREGGSFKKKRSKSADMWREDSMEFSLSDLSQEHLTSTEEIIGTNEDKDKSFTNCGGRRRTSSPRTLETHSGERANSLDELCTQRLPPLRGSHHLYNGHNPERTEGGVMNGEILSPAEEEGNGYGAYTLPCRRSHCLSEGLSNHQTTICSRMQGRRARTTHDITAGEGSEYGDSGIDGGAAEVEHSSRRCKAMSASFSVYSTASGSVFTGSDSGSSSGGGGDRERQPGGDQGVYENFRQELDLNSRQMWDCLEEAGSGASDERSSGTLSSIYPSDILLSTVQGTVRKAGLLAVKNFLGHKKNKRVEPAAKRKWKQYWVSLKGCTLFFYETDGRSGIDHNSIHKHAVWVENSIVQAAPEHPKKDFVFCLSNALGDAFLFQTSGQTELENWITAIHSACAAAVARQHHREDTVRLLRSEIKKLEQKIDMDEKMKKMGEMQLSAVTDGKKRKTILEQIFLWEQNLEQFHMDLFQYRCYLSSLQGGELPNPKRLLAVASRPTKLSMGRLGIFSVSSFHALVAARTDGGIQRRTQALSRSSSKRKSRFSSLWGLDTTSKKKTKGRPSINQVFVDGEESVKRNLEHMFEDTGMEMLKDQEGLVKSLAQHKTDSEVWVPDYLTPSWVSLPDNRPVLAIIQPGETAMEALEALCRAYRLELSKHYIRLKFLVDNQVQLYVPKPEEDLCDLLYKEIEICAKTTKVIQFDRDESCAIGYGFSVVVVEEDGGQQLHITDVKAGGLAFAKGLRAGDEILNLNSKPASVLELADMQAAFSLPSLTLTVSTLPATDPHQLCQMPPRRSDGAQDLCTDIFSQKDILDEGLGLVLHSPVDTGDVRVNLMAESPADSLEDETDSAHKSTEQVTAFCRNLHDMNSTKGPVSCSSSSSTSSFSSSCVPSPISPLPVLFTPRQLSDADKLRKIISELVDTERTYVKDLNILIERYLNPLQKESILSQDELDVLFGNLAEMVEFQVEFLKTLEDGTRLVPDLDQLERVDQFKKVLFSLGGSFLYYADRFKIYSAFCASHTKVPKVLTKAKTDPEFKAFLAERNPRQQHSSTLESYLIKPIQRVLKYPLLLRELHSLTNPDSEEHYHLDVAMKAMNKVASHINEMQKIHEEYGVVFDQLISEQSSDKKEVADLSMGDLLLHDTVVWINPPSSLMKGKRDPELAAFVFRTAVVFVYKDCSKHKKKIGGSHRASILDERDPFRFRHMISTDALQVRNLPNSEGSAMCEIVHMRSESEGRPERTFHICCSSPESKKDFLKTIHSILRDKQRRQLMKTESLPPNQQYIPFGGKRLCALKGSRATMNRAVSAPSRTLGRRKLIRNRFTIDTSVVFDDGSSQELSPISPTEPPLSSLQKPQQPIRDTDRWVEDQFDLQHYENQDDVKETDILSDDDEYCQSVRGPSSEPSLEESLEALSVEGDEDNGLNGLLDDKPPKSHAPLKLTLLRKQCAVEGAASERDCEVIWVRRDDFKNSCNSDIF
ncbi:T-lymphoma invasion and metastasis-inducing protein 1-like isoform X2 [Sinocyclocheilus anshuiensis]|uniref:T-lymphoma invasion and metastasis-inducing protein 1-like isoform X2 n=1 Tax=Sinocyclocheilus anshuiensis TaxID=1608454 RepID=UPI0007BAAE52|nr:PREDICTED: T-lymphoma invasion and metastasis-inducing protein 1-like isoform X2 [Sinocyclocheilus anshuiensis]